MSNEENEGKLLKRIQDKIIENHTYHDGTLVDAQTTDVIFTISEVLEDAKKVLGVDLQAVVNSFGEHAVSSEVKKFTEDFVLWFGSLESVREKSS